MTNILDLSRATQLSLLSRYTPEQSAAFHKSLALFKSFLTPAQLRTFETRRHVDQRTPSGLPFRIYCFHPDAFKYVGNIWLLMPLTGMADRSATMSEELPGIGYCCHLDLSVGLPIPDHWLGQLLALRTHEEEFLETAIGGHWWAQDLYYAHKPGWHVNGIHGMTEYPCH